MRLDLYLAKYYNIQSRNKANELIKNKKVKVNNKIITKPSFKINNKNINLEILEENVYVSRSALKLKYFLFELTDLVLENKIALDIGSSAGGFTQILLENKIKNITCVDIGSNQLHNSIKDDNRIIIKENQDIRDFKSDVKFDIVVCDVSFISIHNIIKSINNLALKDIIILFKPQYEVGKNIKRNKTGVVQDKKAIQIQRDRFINKALDLKWNLRYSSLSKISGKNGNIEELFYFTKDI
jgi:23S rRNA (cytidine1920-2'-O)/16S rRNA (cytidine1409-2'-O)-methyltransferase